MPHEAPLDNPAGRLHRFMSVIAAANASWPIGRVLREHFEIEDGTDGSILLFKRIAEIAALSTQATSELHALDDVNHELHLRWTEGANRSMEWIGRWHDTVNHMQQCFTPADLISMETCADILHRRVPELSIAEDKLSEFVELVRAAIDAIADDPDLQAAVRQQLIARLREVEEALLFIKTTGYHGVEDAMDRLTGTIMRQPTAKTSETARSWCQRIWTFITLATTGVKQISEGTESAIKAIESVQGAVQ